MLMKAATVVQVFQDLFYVLLHVLFYLWSLLNITFARYRMTSEAGATAAETEHGIVNDCSRDDDDSGEV